MEKLFDKLYKDSFTNFNKLLKKFIKKNERKVIITANPETFINAYKNDEFKKQLLSSDTIIIPDGISIVKTGLKFGYNITERIPGVEVVSNILNFLNKEKNKKIYLYGSKVNIIKLMEKYINNNFSNISIVGSKDGYNYNDDEVFNEIIKLKPDLVLVALGIPKQEQLILKYINSFEKGIFIGVGGSFDVLSGYKKRAPKILIKLNLEWFYRLYKEPFRIKRFIKNNIYFLYLMKKNFKNK